MQARLPPSVPLLLHRPPLRGLRMLSCLSHLKSIFHIFCIGRVQLSARRIIKLLMKQVTKFQGHLKTPDKN